MVLVPAGLLLAALTGLLVWCASTRPWDLLVIAILAALGFPGVAEHLTGDVSRYLPIDAFQAGADGKDQIVVASATATILLAISFGAIIWSAARFSWRRLRRRT
jgi:hypothetical protein